MLLPSHLILARCAHHASAALLTNPRPVFDEPRSQPKFCGTLSAKVDIGRLKPMTRIKSLESAGRLSLVVL
jgi:hypothetical protein